MKDVTQVREYLSTHFFKNRRYAYAVRAVVHDAYDEKDFNFKWANIAVKENMSVEEELITANDALIFIFGDKIE